MTSVETTIKFKMYHKAIVISIVCLIAWSMGLTIHLNAIASDLKRIASYDSFYCKITDIRGPIRYHDGTFIVERKMDCTGDVREPKLEYDHVVRTKTYEEAKAWMQNRPIGYENKCFITKDKTGWYWDRIEKIENGEYELYGILISITVIISTVVIFIQV